MTGEEAEAAARLIADRIQGTCSTLPRELEAADLDEGLENNAVFCETLDGLVFCCTSCDWWHEVGDTGNDINGQWACVDCGGAIGEDPEEDD